MKVDGGILPSTGVPNRMSLPPSPNLSTAARAASATEREAVAMKLWPQACPMPSRASGRC